MLDHPDGCLRWVDTLAEEIAEVLMQYRPEAVITFDADGLYWHPDHIGVHERTTEAVQSLGPEAPLLYYVTLAEGAIRAVADTAHARGAAAPGSSLWGISPDAFGFAAPSPTFRIDIRGWAHRKLAALRCHQTQAGPASPFTWIDEADVQRWLGFEFFRRAPLGSGAADALERLAEGDPER
jgi:N-acetyl-1-D-myo-inositol-2-amino-2-deoxy-alpha-D-glucopyranoside deacetylase